MPYTSQLECVEGLRRVIRAQRKRNQLVFGSKDPVASAEPLTAKGLPPHESLGQVERELSAAVESHEARLAENRRRGPVLELDHLSVEHRLDASERRILEVLLVEMTALCEGGRENSVSCGPIARCAAGWDPNRTQALLPYFLSSGRLAQRGIIELMAFSDAEDWRISFGQGVLNRLLSQEGESGVECRTPPAPRGNIVRCLRERGVELNEETIRDLEPVWGLLAHREVVNKKWGLARAPHPLSSVVLLFHGPSGTGKTLTAMTLGSALGRPTQLVSVTDISSMYVGQTQQKLRRAFKEAEKTGAVMVLDEADALFGRRGNVVRAGDRLFNAEVNSALTDIEQFQGICILTTNNPDLLDPAALRRLHCKLHFGPPGPGTRERIWRAHVPPEAPLASDVDFGLLGSEYELTGGQISNAVRTALGTAVTRFGEDDDETEITMDDFRSAAETELRGCHDAGDRNRVIGFR